MAFTSPAMGVYSNLQVLMQAWICAPGTHHGLVAQGSIEHYPTLLHMTSSEN